MTKRHVEQLSGCLNVRGVEISHAADTMTEHMKTEFKGSGCWLHQFSKTHGNANRLTFDEAEGVEPFRKKKNLPEVE